MPANTVAAKPGSHLTPALAEVLVRPSQPVPDIRAAVQRDGLLATPQVRHEAVRAVT